MNAAALPCTPELERLRRSETFDSRATPYCFHCARRALQQGPPGRRKGCACEHEWRASVHDAMTNAESELRCGSAALGRSGESRERSLARHVETHSP